MYAAMLCVELFCCSNNLFINKFALGISKLHRNKYLILFGLIDPLKHCY